MHGTLFLGNYQQLAGTGLETKGGVKLERKCESALKVLHCIYYSGLLIVNIKYGKRFS